MHTLRDVEARISALESKPARQRNNALLLDLYDRRAELIAQAGNAQDNGRAFLAMLKDDNRGCGRIVRRAA